MENTIKKEGLLMAMKERFKVAEAEKHRAEVDMIDSLTTIVEECVGLDAPIVFNDETGYPVFNDTEENGYTNIEAFKIAPDKSFNFCTYYNEDNEANSDWFRVDSRFCIYDVENLFECVSSAIDKMMNKANEEREYIVCASVSGWASQRVKAHSVEEAEEIAMKTPWKFGDDDYEWNLVEDADGKVVIEDVQPI